MPPVLSEFLTWMSQKTVVVGRKLKGLLSSYVGPMKLVVALLVFLVLWMVWNSVKEQFRKEIVILTGPAGTTGRRLAIRIADQLAHTDRIPGIPYSVRLDSTNGFDEMDERVRSDIGGSVISFSQNRKKDTDGIRTLLPLDYDYLHILCRSGFMAEHFPADNLPRQFSAVIEKLQPGTVFVGARGSGTRHVAEDILAQYGRESDDLEYLLNPAISDWYQARAALKRGALDLVFYIGPLGSQTVQEIATDGSAVLLGIDDVRDALVRQQGYALWPLTFPKNAYSAKEWKDERPSESSTAGTPVGLPQTSTSSREGPSKLKFCPDALSTVASRRLLVCSPNMARDDAFLIATAAKNALASDGHLIGNWDAGPSSEAAGPLSDSLGILNHPGADLVKNQAEPLRWWNPITWPPLVASGLSTFLLGLLFEWRASSTRRKSRPSPPPAGQSADDRLHRWQSLSDEGRLSDEEFKLLMAHSPHNAAAPSSNGKHPKPAPRKRLKLPR